MNRFFYAAGPGDVQGTFDHWRAGDSDASEVALTYSGQFFDLCRKLKAEALVESIGPRANSIRDSGIVVRRRPVLFANSSGLAYHFGQIYSGLRMTLVALRFGANVAYVSTGCHWFSLALMPALGIKVIPLLHCTLWPKGYRKTNWVARILDGLNGWFWRNCVSDTVVVSAECERQVKTVAGLQSGRFHLAIAQYDAEYFESISPVAKWEQDPFVFMFAGRITENKGVFRLLDAFEQVCQRSQRTYRLEYCGSGPDLEELRRQVDQRQLNGRVSIHGKLERQGMAAAIGRCHAVCIPTTEDFIEGFNQVVAESVCAGRPFIGTDVLPATEFVPGCGQVVDAKLVGLFAEAMLRYGENRESWDRAIKACKNSRSIFFEREKGFERALEHAIG